MSGTVAEPTWSMRPHGVSGVVDIRPVDPVSDLGLLSAWMSEPHVQPWWDLAGDPDRLRTYLEEIRAKPGKVAWLGWWDAEPVAYIESYVVELDPLAAHFDARPEDRGWHYLVGDPDQLGSGVPRAVARAVVCGLARSNPRTRVVCEPDVRNGRMIRFCEHLGHRRLDTVELSDKSAALMVAERGELEHRWPEDFEGPAIPTEVTP